MLTFLKITYLILFLDFVFVYERQRARHNSALVEVRRGVHLSFHQGSQGLDSVLTWQPVPLPSEPPEKSVSG